MNRRSPTPPRTRRKLVGRKLKKPGCCAWTSDDVNEKVVLVRYDPKWPELASREIAALRKALGRTAIGIEHYGSTSLTEMTSKPIIDILVGVRKLQLSKRIRKSLAGLGYRYIGKRLGQERLYLTKRGKINFNLGVVIYNGELWRNNLGFRDYLRIHSKAADAYEAFKKRLVARGYRRLFEYSDAKKPFVEKIFERARRYTAFRKSIEEINDAFRRIKRKRLVKIMKGY